jgi:SAM-dependent methyltransferase
MNVAHQWICRSRWWKRSLATDLIPWALDGLTLGAETLEIGPGPGLSARVLQPMTRRLVCAEWQPSSACNLGRWAGECGVSVLCADACALPVNAARFDSVVAFTMLHHVAPSLRQDALFAEVARVLKPGGVFAGTDSTDGRIFRMLHWRDTLELVDPTSMPARLRAAGFDGAEVSVRKREFRFRAWRRPV